MIEYKEYQIKPHKDMSSHVIVVTAGRGGKIPQVLDGMFTSATVAKEHIDRYLETKKKE